MESYSNPEIKSAPNAAHVGIFTSYMLGRGGDISAAITFMNQIHKIQQLIEFDWVVKTDYLGVGKDALQERLKAAKLSDCVNLHLTTMNEDNPIEQKRITGLSLDERRALAEANWKKYGWGDEFWQKKFDKRKAETDNIFPALDKTVALCVVATLHRFSQKDCERFHTVFPHKPFYSFTEYDYSFDYKNGRYRSRLNAIDKKHQFSFLTGLGQGHSGVYQDEYMFSDEKLSSIAKDQPGENFLLNYLASSDDYASGKFALFFGYFFVSPKMHEIEDPTSLVKCGETIINFARMATYNPNTACIDIVIPTNDKLMLLQEVQHIFNNDELPKELKDRKLKVELIMQDDQLREIKAGDPMGKDLTIRVISPARLTPKTIQCILNSSASVCAMTGDQSPVEGLIKGKLVFYQAMKWKLQLLKSICQCCHNLFGSEGLLSRFYKLQMYQPQKDEAKARQAAWDTLINFYLQNRVLLEQQAKQLAGYIRKNKNIQSTLRLVAYQFRRLQQEKESKKVQSNYVKKTASVVSAGLYAMSKSSKEKVQIEEEGNDITAEDMAKHAFGFSSNVAKANALKKRNNRSGW